MALRIGLGLGLSGGVSFSPLSLFAASEPGFWYDPSDLTTLFQDTAGTTPVTAAGQSVGLVLDKSKGLVLEPELVTNGDFSSATGWITGAGWSITGGQLVGTTVTGTAATTQTINTGAGRWFAVTFTVVSVSAGQVSIGMGASLGTARSSPGTYTEYFIGTAATNAVSVYQRISNFTGTIDNISVRELPGNHAAQSTSLSRPTLGRNPSSGTRNLLTYTEQFDNAAWTKTRSSITANAIAAPDGTTTADKLVEDTTASITHAAQSAIITFTATSYTGFVYLKAAERTWALVRVGSSGANVNAYFDLANGVVGTVGASATASITAVGNGWYKCTVSGTAAAGADYGVSVFTATGNNVATYTGDGTSGLFIWGAQLELGSTATAYQKVVSAFDVTEAGKADCWYLGFDGSDDFLVTPTITPGTDKAQVFAGVRKLSDAAIGMVAELNNATTYQIQLYSNNAPSFVFVSRGSNSIAAVSAANFASPATAVLTGIGDIGNDVSTIRANTAAVNNTADQGTPGNYGAAPVYIGRRGGTTLPFNGRIYSLICRFGSNLTADQIAQTETWVNARTGAY